MPADALTVVAGVNRTVAVLLENSKQALTGQSTFGVDQVRALREPLDQMDAILKRAGSLRQENPELAEQIDIYRDQLKCLQTTLVQVRMMLLGRRLQVESGRRQLSAVHKWAAALDQIR